MDAAEQRQAILDTWERAAPGWRTRRAELQQVTGAVSQWMVEAIQPQPGQTVLELAAGPGDTGLLAAELLRPGGRLISSDAVGGMVDIARERTAELGLDDVVEFRRLDAESIDLPTASVDAVLCRWAYMLMPDAEAALRETRRVLRPGGRLALAVWATAEQNPWASAGMAQLRRMFDQPEPDPDAPGMFSLGDPQGLEARLQDAGFTDVVVDAVDLRFEHPSFEHWWQARLDCSPVFGDALSALEEGRQDELRADLERTLEAYDTPDGGLSIPGRSLVAAARA